MSLEVTGTVELLQAIQNTLSQPTVLKPEYLDYSSSTLYQLETSKTTKQDNPDLTYRNPLARDIAIHEISIIFDSNFSAKGRLIIDVDNTRIFEQIGKANFTRVQDLQLVFRKPRILKSNKEIKFYIWNAIDGTEIKADLLIGVGR